MLTITYPLAHKISWHTFTRSQEVLECHSTVVWIPRSCVKPGMWRFWFYSVWTKRVKLFWSHKWSSIITLPAISQRFSSRCTPMQLRYCCNSADRMTGENSTNETPTLASLRICASRIELTRLTFTPVGVKVLTHVEVLFKKHEVSVSKTRLFISITNWTKLKRWSTLIYCFDFVEGFDFTDFLVSIVVSIPACHAGDRGSIPRRGVERFYSQSQTHSTWCYLRSMRCLWARQGSWIPSPIERN